ncbi:MAG TPA: Xaa-Pro dipeptidase, partial [Blastocatellia bacterium]|nr:Xaa-Pro dipeptidase [Blastocatellia bacterium]
MKPSLRFSSSVRLLALASAFALLSINIIPAPAQSQNIKALVGGTLIDGYGSKPITNSVILIE